MDPRGNIYHSENVPPEDEARLEGFLRGRAEADKAEHDKLMEEVKREAYEAKVREMEERERRA